MLNGVLSPPVLIVAPSSFDNSIIKSSISSTAAPSSPAVFLFTILVFALPERALVLASSSSSAFIGLLSVTSSYSTTTSLSSIATSCSSSLSPKVSASFNVVVAVVFSVSDSTVVSSFSSELVKPSTVLSSFSFVSKFSSILFSPLSTSTISLSEATLVSTLPSLSFIVRTPLSFTS